MQCLHLQIEELQISIKVFSGGGQHCLYVFLCGGEHRQGRGDVRCCHHYERRFTALSEVENFIPLTAGSVIDHPVTCSARPMRWENKMKNIIIYPETIYYYMHTRHFFHVVQHRHALQGAKPWTELPSRTRSEAHLKSTLILVRILVDHEHTNLNKHLLSSVCNSVV